MTLGHLDDGMTDITSAECVRFGRSQPFNQKKRGLQDYVGLLRFQLALYPIFVGLIVGTAVSTRTGHEFRGSLTLAEMIAQICVSERVEPAYLVGKGFAAMLGPAAMYADVKEDIPFLQETRMQLSYTRIHPIDQGSCRTIVKAMHEKVAASGRFQRLHRLRACAETTIGRNVSRAGRSERHAWHVLDHVLSEVALSLDYSVTLLCRALGSQNVAVAFVTVLGGSPLPGETANANQYTETECGDKGSEDGRCLLPSGAIDLRHVAMPMRAAMVVAMNGCNHVAWWLCTEASVAERAANADTFAPRVVAATARLLSTLLDQLRWEGRQVVNQAYRWVLNREADATGHEEYGTLLAHGGSAETIGSHLLQSREYLEHSKQAGLDAASLQVRNIFSDVLLRQPELEAIKVYAAALQEAHGAAHVRRILMASDEYKELCLRSDRASCEEAREAVRRVFAQEMGRPPDNQGLASYSREVVLGHLSLDHLRVLLRGSDEYRFGVRLRLLGRDAAAQVQASYASCWQEAEQHHRGGHHDVGATVLGPGRWCIRGGCSTESDKPCAHWPLAAYQQVQAVALGLAQVDDVVVWGRREQDGTRWEESKQHQVLAKHTGDLSAMVGMHASVLGRFPSARELQQGAARLSSGSMTRDEMMVALRRAEGEEEEMGVEEEEEWAHKIELLANMLHDANVSLPPSVQEHLARGHMLSELGVTLLCKRIADYPLSDPSQAPPPRHPECLPARASRIVCAEREWLCGPFRGRKPSPAVFEIALGAEHGGLPSLVASWVYLPRGSNSSSPRAHGRGCVRMLRSLQERWNDAAPLYNARPALAKPAAEDEAEVPPIALYVYQRRHYFQKALSHLRAVRGIDAVPVLVISMDDVRRDMLDIALSVDFVPCRIVFHPVRVDGRRMQAVLGVKTHWMWLQDMLWTAIPETRERAGHIALLEEDHVVTPDYLELLGLLLDLKGRECPRCWAVCVKYGCRGMLDRETYKVCKTHSVMNTGIAFNRSTYLAIKRSDFLSFADGWDWSLFHLAQTGQMADMMLAPAVSRIRNIGVEGVTVTDDGDGFLLNQLDYADVGQHAAFQRQRFWIDSSVHMQYVPPAWEPLFLGGLGFVAS